MSEIVAAAKMEGNPQRDEHDDPIDGLEPLRYSCFYSERSSYRHIDLSDHFLIRMDDAQRWSIA